MPALKDGYQTLIAFAADNTVEIWEKTVTPMGLEGGDKIDQTVMANANVRTYAPRALIDVSDGSMTVAYDPLSLTKLLALINVNTTITVTLPDGSTWTFWGYLKSFIPGELTEGEQPEAECEIVATNVNDSDVETVPAYAAAP